MDLEYEHECSRAELLGLPKPTRDEFDKHKTKHTENVGENENDEDVSIEVAREKGEIENERKEGFRRVTGGLDELNGILVNTQKKLNRIKNAFGNFTSTIKNQTLIRKEQNEASGNKKGQAQEENGTEEDMKTKHQLGSPYRLKKTEESDVDKLDLLISKAERAEMSLSSQNKQMKKFLN